MNEIMYAGKHLVTYVVQPHTHDSWELIYCTTGCGTFRFQSPVETIDYVKGDIVIIPPGVSHSNEGKDGFTNIHLNLAVGAFAARMPFLVQDDAGEHLLHAFTDAFYFYHSSLDRRDLILNGLGNLIANYVTAFQSTESFPKVVEAIIQSIVSNFPNVNYELDTFLRSLPFNYDYLRKLFKNEVGITPHAYLEKIRMETAAGFLRSMDSDHSSVAKIAQDCGYEDALYFSRTFKKHFGLSPTAYAKQEN